MQGLKQKREERGLTQTTLAQAIGVQQSAVAQWESGTVELPRKKWLDKLCKLFNCKIDDLL